MKSSPSLPSGVKKNSFQSYQKKGLSKAKDKIAEKLKDKSKDLGSKLKDGVKKAGDSIKNGANAVIDSKVSTVTNAISLGQDMASGLSKTLLDVSPAKADSVPIPKTEEDKKTEENKKAEDEKAGTNKEDIKKLDRPTSRGKRPIDKPAIFFVKGMEMFSFSSDNDGLEEMKGAYKNAKVFDWDQKEQMLSEIKRRPKHQPVVLVGHSLGADTAVEIANELNSLDNRFRQVDLLVTLDSVGSNNDIISQNVKRNMNFITESTFFGDEPNIARNSKKTNVTNDLKEFGHRELDNNTEIQFEIINEIDKLVY